MNTDWRLPNIEELQLLYENQNSIGGFDSSSTAMYWSSIGYMINSGAKHFKYGYNDITGKSNNFRVRCVKNVKWEDLGGKRSQNVPFKTQLHFDGENVIYGGMREDGFALIIATQDELGPRGDGLMNWFEADNAVKCRNECLQQNDKSQNVLVKQNYRMKM